MYSSLLNLTFFHLAVSNVLNGPFLSFNRAIQLSIYQSQISRFTNHFLCNVYGQVKVTDSSFSRVLNEVFCIGKSTLLPLVEYTNYSHQITVDSNSNAFFGCCYFIDIPKAIYSEPNSQSTVKIKRCCFYGQNENISLISLPDNKQIIIEDSYFIIRNGGFASSRGLFIYSQPSTDTDTSSYFSLSRTFFGFESEKPLDVTETRDTICSKALFHDINYVNMTNINLGRCIWGICLGLQTKLMIRIKFSNFNYNNGFNLIWIWNLPDRQHQKVYSNSFIGNAASSLFYIENSIYFENCFFPRNDFTNTVMFRRYNDANYNAENTTILRSFTQLVFNLSVLQPGFCMASDPPATLTATCSQTPSKTNIPQRSSSPTQSDKIVMPTMTPPPTMSPSRSPWPTMTPLPTYTPTPKPPYLPIFGITFAVVFAICLIIFIIVFFCREYKHKSSEDTIGERAVLNLSGVGENSYSSETDPLNLNTSSDDSFMM